MAATDFLDRFRFAGATGKKFAGNRDVNKALGYDEVITATMYRDRYRRNAVAARIIEAKPQSTWRGGGEIVEDENTEEMTTFEKEWAELDDRLNIWTIFHRADVIAGLGEYSIIVWGAPGNFEAPLTNLEAKDLQYLQVFSQENAPIESYESKKTDVRYGFPLFYNLKQATIKTGQISPIQARKVHWTRVTHVADGLLEDNVFGTPRLERVWNLLDDLEKVTGGGAEAFWKRADQGLHLNIDPSIPVDKTGEADKKLQAEIDEYVHGLNRILRTRGMEVEPLGSDVASFSQPVDAIIAQIAAGTGIPQRILMGSERGHLASTQDRDNWAEQIHDRRQQYAAPIVVKPFVRHAIELGVLSKPKQTIVRWPEMQVLNEAEKMTIVETATKANQQQGEQVITTNEIRGRILGMAPRTDQELEKDRERAKPPVNPINPINPAKPGSPQA